MTNHTNQAVTDEPFVLQEGQAFTAQTTGMLRGQRVYRTHEFVSSHTQMIEKAFIPGDLKTGRPAQDRVRISQHYPATYYRAAYSVDTVDLVVSGSIKVAP